MSSDGISARELIASGVHFGHKVSRWNPKMSPFIFGRRNSIHIIDVKSTITGLLKAAHFLENLAKRNELVLLVGTKRQAGTVVKEEAARCSTPFVSERWIGGTLTNYTTIRERLRRLEEIETWEEDGTLSRYNKKEISKLMRQKRKLLRNLDGIRKLDRMPAALVIVDPHHEKIAVAEANKIGAATIALIDSDGNPDDIDIPIPGNDDSMKVIQIVIRRLADAILEGRSKSVGMTVPEKEEPPKPAPPDVVSLSGQDLRRGRGPRATTPRPKKVQPAPPAETKSET